MFFVASHQINALSHLSEVTYVRVDFGILELKGTLKAWECYSIADHDNGA